MFSFRFKHVCLEAYAVNLPPNELSSDTIEDRLAAVYQRLSIPLGTLEKLSGIKTRYFWPNGTLPSQPATEVSKLALEKIGFDRSHIGAIINTSVTRDYFEPATACIVHGNLGLAETTVAFDVTNACIGFSNGIFLLANMIESGMIKAGIIVSAEVLNRFLDSSLEYVQHSKDVSRDNLLKLLPAFTLGSGSVAWVLAHESIATQRHRIVGGVARSATQFNDLCNGNNDYCVTQPGEIMPVMLTESQKLISSASKLGARVWPEASQVLGWNSEAINHIFCHQVGKQVNEAFFAEQGLDYSKEYTIYRKYGNLVSAALPTAVALGIDDKPVRSGEKLLLTAYGSGLNTVFTGIEW